MLYCEHCKRIIDEKVCPVCHSRHVREPQPGDECFLIEKPALWENPISDFLRSEGIRFRSVSTMGAWLSARIGNGMERFVFYVPYEVLEQAQRLMEDYFTPVEDADEEEK